MIWEQETPKSSFRLTGIALAGTVLFFLFTWLLLPYLQWTVNSANLPEYIMKIVEIQKRKKQEQKELVLQRAQRENRHVQRQLSLNRSRRENRRIQRQMQRVREVVQRETRTERKTRALPTESRIARNTENTRAAKVTEIPVREARSAPPSRMERGRPAIEGKGRSGIEATPHKRAAAGDAPIIRKPVVVEETKYSKMSMETINPIIDWISRNRSPIPEYMKKPELFDYAAGDVTTLQRFETADGRSFLMYLLGRKGTPPQLKIFLVTGNEGTLLQDLGAKGASEMFKYGTVALSPDQSKVLLVDLQLLPAGHPKASEMMSVFTSWWKSVQ